MARFDKKRAGQAGCKLIIEMVIVNGNLEYRVTSNIMTMTSKAIITYTELSLLLMKEANCIVTYYAVALLLAEASEELLLDSGGLLR